MTCGNCWRRTIRRRQVDDLDLSAINARYDEPRRFPPYDPQMMVTIIIYAYCIGETSSRRIFQALQENIAFSVLATSNQPTTKQAMELLLGTNEGRAAYSLRGQTVEPVNGQLKDRGGMREFKLRGLEGTKLEASLTCLGNNLKKLYRWSKKNISNRNEDDTTTGQRAAASVISGGAGRSGHLTAPSSG